jgi:NAD(P)H dehydrogenase (quinone)
MSKPEEITVAVVYHSGYGHTAKVAEAVARGAEGYGNTKSILIRVEDADQYWDQLAQADAIIFGAPTYMGSVSAEFKTFMDLSCKQVFMSRAWANKVAAGFTNSGSRSGDKLFSLQQIFIYTAQLQMHWVNLGLMSGHTSSTSTEDTLNRHGYFIGLGTQSDVDSPPEIAPPPADLKTAEHLGARVARVALELKLGRKALEEKEEYRPLIAS